MAFAYPPDRLVRPVTDEYTRHDFDTRATQNDEKRGQHSQNRIILLTCDDAELTVAAKVAHGRSKPQHADFTISDVVFTKTGPRIMASMLVNSWGSSMVRTVMLANPLSSYTLPGAKRLSGGGTFLLVDANGAVVHSTDPQLAGTRLPWWRNYVERPRDAASTTVSINGVENHATGYHVPRMSWTVAFVQPESQFFGSRAINNRTELVIMVLAALVGILVAALGFKRHQDSRKSEQRLNALLENVGDAVLEV